MQTRIWEKDDIKRKALMHVVQFERTTLKVVAIRTNTERYAERTLNQQIQQLNKQRKLGTLTSTRRLVTKIPFLISERGCGRNEAGGKKPPQQFSEKPRSVYREIGRKGGSSQEERPTGFALNQEAAQVAAESANADLSRMTSWLI